MSLQEFYAQHKLPIGRIVLVGTKRHGLTKTAVVEAMRQVFEDVQAGTQIRTIRLAWEVFARAKSIMAVRTIASMEREDEMAQQIENLRSELAWARKPWYEKLTWRTYVNSR